MQEQRLVDIIMPLQSSPMLSLNQKILYVGASEMRSSFQRSLRKAYKDSPISSVALHWFQDTILQRHNPKKNRRETRTRSEDPKVPEKP